MPRTIEQISTRIVDGNAKMLIPWMLIAAYAYNQLEEPLVSDEVYDIWARRLHRVWWRVKHRHKDLISKGETTCQVLLKEDQYPGMVIGATLALIQLHHGGRYERHLPRHRRLSRQIRVGVRR